MLQKAIRLRNSLDILCCWVAGPLCREQWKMHGSRERQPGDGHRPSRLTCWKSNFLLLTKSQNEQPAKSPVKEKQAKKWAQGLGSLLPRLPKSWPPLPTWQRSIWLCQHMSSSNQEPLMRDETVLDLAPMQVLSPSAVFQLCPRSLSICSLSRRHPKTTPGKR